MRTRNFQLGFGVLLVVLVVIYLLVQLFVPSANVPALLGTLGLLVIAGAFLALYFDTRTYGFLIPGAVLAGMGIGTLFPQLLAGTDLPEVGGGLVVFWLGLGFLAIYFVGKAVSGMTSPWPVIPGGILAGIGILVALASLVAPEFQGPIIVGGIGVGFLIAYFVTKLYGLAVPGCIMLGIGGGVALTQAVVLEPNAGSAEAGLILLGMGAGFVLIYILDLLYSRASNWWPLVPGLILLVLGAILYSAGAAPDVLKWWPALLVLGGLWAIVSGLRRARRRQRGT